MCHAERTHARDYLVFARMLKRTPLECSKVTMDGHIPLIKALEDLPDPPKVEVPKVMQGVWASPDNKIGYVMVNWNSQAEEVTRGLVKKQRSASIISAAGRRAVPEQQVRAGHITLSVPAWSVVLAEQS